MKAREEVDSRIAQLDGAGLRRSALYAGLLEKARELRTLEALQTSNARVVRQADRAVKIFRTRADLVLIDSPPLLHVADSMALSARVGALIVVTQLNAVRRRHLRELRRVLDACPAAKLGIVLTDSDAEETYGYGYDYAYGRYDSPTTTEAHAARAPVP